jgi:hypothetical protein
VTLKILACCEHDTFTPRNSSLVCSYLKLLAQRVLLKHLVLRLGVLMLEKRYFKAWRVSFQPPHELLPGDPSLPTHTRSLKLSWTDAVPQKNNRALDLFQRVSWNVWRCRPRGN